MSSKPSGGLCELQVVLPSESLQLGLCREESVGALEDGGLARLALGVNGIVPSAGLNPETNYWVLCHQCGRSYISVKISLVERRSSEWSM